MSKKKVTLACQECRSKNYVKNKTNDERLIISKFCKKCVKSTLHKEEK